MDKVGSVDGNIARSECSRATLKEAAGKVQSLVLGESAQYVIQGREGN